MTLFRVWISSEDAAAVANLGYRLIQAPSNYFYLVRVPLFSMSLPFSSQKGLWCG